MHFSISLPLKGLLIATVVALSRAAVIPSRNSPLSVLAARDTYLPPDADIGIAKPKRAAPDVGYTPTQVDCPDQKPVIRDAKDLSQQETNWLKLRSQQSIPAMKDLLGRLKIDSFDVDSYFSANANNLPNIAIAASGGGYRALLNGAGAIKAFDSREPGGTDPGSLGGLLQASTYVSGLSGGGWLVSTIFMNNFTTISALQNDARVWHFENSILEGPQHTGIAGSFDVAKYWKEVHKKVEAKKDAGFKTSITDYWGLTLAQQLINDTDGGPSYTWASIGEDANFANGNYPMPLLTTDERAPGTLAVPGTTPIYEINPFEFGTWDSTTHAFAPVKYVGTAFDNGAVPDGTKCVAGFVGLYGMATSSSLFNQFLLHVDSETQYPKAIRDIVKDILTDVSNDEFDIANWQPNPFAGYQGDSALGASTDNAASQDLTMCDGGEDAQNVPFHPLLQNNRKIDTIFAVDSTADSNNWPIGSTLVATSKWAKSPNAKDASFPEVPDNNTIVNLQLNNHPSFYGCDAGTADPPPPLIVYLPNSPYTYWSNVSTFAMKHDQFDRDNIILNGYNVVTMGNATADSTWPTCVGCAIMKRSWDRTKTQIPDACTQCFTKYCWTGKTASDPPTSTYEPIMWNNPKGGSPITVEPTATGNTDPTCTPDNNKRNWFKSKYDEDVKGCQPTSATTATTDTSSITPTPTPTP